MEEAFLECMTGKAKHRLKEAKVVLRSTEPEVVQFLATWRKRAHFCHANALAQQWFLTGEWHGLRGVTLGPWCEEKSLTAQMAVAEIVTKMLGRCEIQSKGDTPKLVRCSVNLDIFRETAGVITPGLQYFRRLQETHQAAWWKVGGAKKLARRLLIDGEPNLRSIFMAAYEQSGHDVAKMSFSETSLGSDFAMVEEKLALAMPKQAAAQPPADGAALQAQAAAGIDAAAAQTEVAQKEAAAHAAAESAKKAAAEAAAAREQKQADEAAKRKQEEEVEEVAAMRNETRIAMDDVMTFFDNVPRHGCPAPAQVKHASWVLFVIPVQAYVRGRPAKAMPRFQTKYLQELRWVSPADMVLVGCGHDPSGVQAVTSNLKQHFEALKAFTWSPLVPVVQARSRRKHYVEYMLTGVGPECPCKGSGPSFVQSKKGYPSIKLRPRRCDKPLPGIVAGNGDEEGDTVWCGTYTWARGRFLASLPNQPSVVRKPKQDQDDIVQALGLGDDNAGQDESSDSEEGSVDTLELGVTRTRRKHPFQKHREVTSGIALGGGVGQRRHGSPSWRHCAHPYQFCAAVSIFSPDS